MLFTERLMLLINQKGISKNKMLVDLQLGKNSFINWETRGNTPDGETLLKISQYFGVTVDYLLGNDPQKRGNMPIVPPYGSAALPDDLTQRETNLILRYRQKPEMQAAVDKLLGLPDDDEPLIPVYIAARSDTNEPDRIEYLTKEEAERLKNAPPAKFDF